MGSGKNGRHRYAELIGLTLAGMFSGCLLYELIGVYLLGESPVPYSKVFTLGIICTMSTAFIFYKNQMKLTDEEWEAVKKTREQARKREVREEIQKEQQKNSL